MRTDRATRTTTRLRLAALCLAVAAVGGCQLTPAPGLVSCPLPAGDQAARILAIAPLGTERDDVLQRLKEAGVAGNFGENKSIYYCDTWRQDDKSRWHINVMLLFDENGKLYATRPEPGGRPATAAAGAANPADNLDPPGDGPPRDPFE